MGRDFGLGFQRIQSAFKDPKAAFEPSVGCRNGWFGRLLRLRDWLRRHGGRRRRRERHASMGSGAGCATLTPGRARTGPSTWPSGGLAAEIGAEYGARSRPVQRAVTENCCRCVATWLWQCPAVRALDRQPDVDSAHTGPGAPGEASGQPLPCVPERAQFECNFTEAGICRLWRFWAGASSMSVFCRSIYTHQGQDHDNGRPCMISCAPQPGCADQVCSNFPAMLSSWINQPVSHRGGEKSSQPPLCRKSPPGPLCPPQQGDQPLVTWNSLPAGMVSSPKYIKAELTAPAASPSPPPATMAAAEVPPCAAMP